MEYVKSTRPCDTAVWEPEHTLKFSTSQNGTRCIDWAALEQVHLADSVRALLATAPCDRFFDIIEPTYLEFTLELCSTFQLQTVMTVYDDLGTIQFRFGGLVRQLSVPEFGVALGLYTENFMEADNFPHLHRHIHYALFSCWAALIPTTSIYDPSRSKASALSPALRYLHALLAHTLTGRRESTGVTSSPSLLPSNRTTPKGSHQHRPLRDSSSSTLWALNTLAQSSSLTLIDQMSPQGISSMLHMRMRERRHGFDPPQYRLAQAIDQMTLRILLTISLPSKRTHLLLHRRVPN
ncbi:hypothetical protein GOBAR_AA19486 [Gossypium barbadense]|uniref:Arabidopsis retrotransposon Orf1 C-terminal domain-containing protein n=1 Tax=Gossypium barbadense TaxID=3634 RepID=A0A2P5XCW2_GOSBA|nr:hypothetical protein GOBAR_AA19486 [Gossypium barbadense]